MSGTKGKRVVLVDDDTLFAEQITALLAHHGGLETICVTNGKDLFKTLDELEVSCVLLDYTLSGETGLGLGQAIKQRYLPSPPIIMLTASGSERTAMKAIRIGFDDYVSKKNLDIKELIWAIDTAVTSHNAEVAMHQETEMLRAQRRVDSLTGYASAGFVQARLNELAFSKDGNGFTVLSILLHHFDDYRLQFGHATSERLFRDFTSRMGDVDLAGGYLGHLSVHRLACIFETRVDPSTIENVTRRIADVATMSMEVDGSRLELSPIFGHSFFPADGSTPEEVVNHAIAEAMKQEEAIAAPHEVMAEQVPEAEASAEMETSGGHLPTFDRRSGAGRADGEDRRQSNRRREPRYRVLKKGKISIRGLNSIVDCVVRNLSESGAQIRVEGYFVPPNRFQLKILGHMDDFIWVEKRWQVGNDIGVLFKKDEQ
jgi:two-component system cell cycle response regulator